MAEGRQFKTAYPVLFIEKNMARKKIKRRPVFKRGGSGRVRKDSLSIGKTYADRITIRREK